MWIYDGKTIEEALLEDYLGFVYLITNTLNGRKYIGKKLLKFRRTKKIKGKKKRVLVDSDWKNYWGSNKALIEDVKVLGEEKFTREIIRLCKAKGEMNYYEAKYQFDSSVLESSNWYNDWIMTKVHRAHLKLVDFTSDSGIIKLRMIGDAHAPSIKKPTSPRPKKSRIKQATSITDA